MVENLNMSHILIKRGPNLENITSEIVMQQEIRFEKTMPEIKKFKMQSSFFSNNRGPFS